MDSSNIFFKDQGAESQFDYYYALLLILVKQFYPYGKHFF